jgi:hypothetical protein
LFEQMFDLSTLIRWSTVAVDHPPKVSAWTSGGTVT